VASQACQDVAATIVAKHLLGIEPSGCALKSRFRLEKSAAKMMSILMERFLTFQKSVGKSPMY
jgi:hypothetical protein